MAEPLLLVRSAEARDLALRIARRENSPISSVVERALEAYESLEAGREPATAFYRRIFETCGTVVIMVELGVVTPPIGVNVFAIASMTKEVSMYDIFRGVFPFWIAFLILIGLIVLFPQISLFLPSLM